MNQINESLQKKTAARIAAVQCVYGRMVGEEKRTAEQQLAALKKRLANNKEEQKLTLGMALEPNYALVKAIIEGTLEWQGDIDKRIDKSLSKEWTRERTSEVLLAILQCAIFELFFFKDDIKHKVLIDEYSRLTSRFFGDAEISFVNGLLKTLCTELQIEIK